MGRCSYADHRAADAESRHHEISDDQRHPSVLDWFGNLWRNFAFTPLAGPCGISAISLPLAAHEHGLPLGGSTRTCLLWGHFSDLGPSLNLVR